MHSVKQTCEELYPDWQVEEMTIEQEQQDMLSGEAVLAETTYYLEKAKREELPGRFGRTWPEAHSIKKACSGVSSPRFHVTTQ